MQKVLNDQIYIEMLNVFENTLIVGAVIIAGFCKKPSYIDDQ